MKEAKVNNELPEVITASDEPQSVSEEIASEVKPDPQRELNETGEQNVGVSDNEKDDPAISAEDIERMMKYAKIL